MPKQNRNKQVAVKLPQSREECAELIAKMARLDLRETMIQAVLDESIERATAGAEDQAAEVRLAREGFLKAVQSYCEVNKKELTKDGKQKTFKFTTGKVNWKKNADVVTVEKGQTSEIADMLTKMKQTQCLKTSVSLVKTELKKLSPDQLKKLDGVSIKPGDESFTVTPNSLPADFEQEGREAGS